MEYKINQVPEDEEYRIGDYYVDDDGWLYRIISTKVSGGIKYALLNVEAGRLSTSLYFTMDDLVEYTFLNRTTKVTQTKAAEFEQVQRRKQ